LEKKEGYPKRVPSRLCTDYNSYPEGAMYVHSIIVVFFRMGIRRIYNDSVLQFWLIRELLKNASSESYGGEYGESPTEAQF
jgi:hypothetical protein